jgi:hypothetical protein
MHFSVSPHTHLVFFFFATLGFDPAMDVKVVAPFRPVEELL